MLTRSLLHKLIMSRKLGPIPRKVRVRIVGLSHVTNEPSAGTVVVCSSVLQVCIPFISTADNGEDRCEPLGLFVPHERSAFSGCVPPARSTLPSWQGLPFYRLIRFFSYNSKYILFLSTPLKHSASEIMS